MSTHIDVTSSRQSYIPYTMLQRGSVCLMFGKVPLNITMSSLNSCLVSVPPSFRIKDSDRDFDMISDEAENTTLSAFVGLGTSFVVSYHGSECEVRLGRKITITDAGEYMQD